MHQTLLRVFVVAFGLLIFRDDPGLKEKDELFLRSDDEMEEEEEISSNLYEAPKWYRPLEEQEKEERLVTIQVISPDNESKTVEPNQTNKSDVKEEQQDFHDQGWESDLLWYLWNTFSLVSTLLYFKKYSQSKSFLLPVSAEEVRLPDHRTLLRFYNKHLHQRSQWEEEFLDGFTDELLTCARVVCEQRGGLTIQNFTFTNASDVMVPLTPLEPYRIQGVLREDQVTMQPCGLVEMVDESAHNSCYCQSSDVDDDMVCLLHGEAGKSTRANHLSHLCVENSNFLSKSQTIRWFRSIIKQAWSQISHKYDFKVSVSYLGAPCSLIILFKSCRKLTLKLNPVVKLHSSAHLCVTHFPEDSDSLWSLSLGGYEDALLDYINEQLPDEACHMQVLEIAHFLHRKQVSVTGACALTEPHFRTALIHLLLRTKPTQWQSDQIAARLRDLLVFVDESLQTKSLHQAFVGLRSGPQLPAELTQAKSANLFQPMVAHQCLYRHTVAHYREVLLNSYMLILDYVGENC